MNYRPSVRIEEPVAGPTGVRYIAIRESGPDTESRSENIFNQDFYFLSDEVNYDSEDAPVK